MLKTKLILSSSSSVFRRIMSTFTLPSTTTKVHLPPDLIQSQLLSFKPFNTWLSTLQSSLSRQTTSETHAFKEDPYSLRSITVQAVDFFGPPGKQRVGFLKLRTEITTLRTGESLPGSVFLRGGSVAILLILEEEEEEGRVEDSRKDKEPERHVVLTVQPRIAAGSLEFLELPAGMLDDGTFSGAAAKEIHEECGIEILEDKLVDLTALALGPQRGGEGEFLQDAVYPSPGGCDEFLKVFAYVHRVPKETVKEWQGRLTGLRDEGEKISLKVVGLGELWRETRDVKALCAVALWEGLKREGKV